MERKQAIRSAYRLTGAGSFYDGMITCSTLPGKAVGADFAADELANAA